MKTSGVITNSVFGFYLAAFGQSSYLDIGIVDLTAMKDSTNMYYQNIVPNNYWWSNYVTGVAFSSPTGSNAWGLNSYFAVIDSGASCTYVPTYYYVWFLNQLRTLGLNYINDG